MTEEEGWENYGLEAVKHVLQHGILSKQFTEAARVMKLTPHEHVSRHYEKMEKIMKLLWNF